MEKYVPLITVMIAIFVSVGLITNSAIAAEELSVQETIDLPTTTFLFGEKTLNTSPFGEFVVGPEKNFFVLPGSVSDTPVIKFTENGEPKKIQAIEKGVSDQTISSVSRGIALSSDQNVIVAGSREPYEFTLEGNLIDQYSLEKSKAELGRLVDVAADPQGNIYMVDMNDQIKKISSDGSIDTSQINKQAFNEEIPGFSTPTITATDDYLFVLMGQTDKLLKYTHGGELVDNIKLPQREFAGSQKNRTITEILATKSGDLVALQNDLDNRILILDGNGSIKRSYKIPQSISETGRTALADIALGPDGNLYTISTTRNPASSDSEQTNLIKSADIGLDRQYNQTDNRSDNSKSSSKSSSQDESGDSNDTDTQGYWETGATSSPPDQSRAEIGTLMKLSNALQQLKVLVSIQ